MILVPDRLLRGPLIPQSGGDAMFLALLALPGGDQAAARGRFRLSIARRSNRRERVAGV